MLNLIVTTRSGEETKIGTDAGMSVMEAVRDAGIAEIKAMCGGCCSCATCHVYLDKEFANAFAPMSNVENDLLDTSGHRKEQSRLSCQLRMQAAANNVRVTIAPEE